MSISGLIPARFLTIIGHLVLTIILFWARDANVTSCLPQSYTEADRQLEDERLLIGLCVTVVLLVLELGGFLSGLSMFMATQDLLSLGAHATACIVLAFFLFESWPCYDYWWIFGFCSALPGLTEILVIIGVARNWAFCISDQR